MCARQEDRKGEGGGQKGEAEVFFRCVDSFCGCGLFFVSDVKEQARCSKCLFFFINLFLQAFW